MGFKSAKEMEKRFKIPTSNPLPSLSTKKKRGRPTKKDIEEDIFERDKDLIANEEKKKKRKLIDMLYSENDDIPIEEIIKQSLLESDIEMPKKGGKKTARASTALTGTKNMLEDMLSIDQLKEFIEENRRRKQDKASESEPETSSTDILTLLPLLQNLQSQNQEQVTSSSSNLLGNIDTNQLLLLQMLSGNQKKSGGMNPLLLLLMLNSQNQPQPQNSQMNMELFKLLYNEMQNKQQQQTGIDPNTLLLLKVIGQDKGGNPDFDKLMMKIERMMEQNRTNQLQMIMQRSDDRNAQGMELVASAIQSNPKKELMETFSMFNQIAGDRRAKNKDEMEYDLKKYELNIHEDARRDTLDREERALEREDRKSDRFLDGVNTVADKILGDGGIGNLIVKGISSRGPKRRKSEDADNLLDDDIPIDLSDLDDL